MEILGVRGEKLYSRNLGDLLRLEEDHRVASSSGVGDGDGNGNGNGGLTLYAILCQKITVPPSAAPSTRTLLDVINEERISATRIDGRRSWRNLTDKIRLRRRGGVSDSPYPEPHPTSGNPQSGSISSQISSPLDNNPARISTMLTGDVNEGAAGGDDRNEEPARVSLMTLLAENDRHIGSDGTAFVVMSGEDAELEEDSSASSGVGGGGYNCCVCMVRHKGAAFIPCGHTFCRRCSREVWVQRGHCPLCNNAIVEILDIF